MTPTLTNRALNRALLARQMLLARERTPTVRAVEKLAGMQAQQPRPPFVGLWSRVDAFERSSLSKALEDRKVVRATMMRATIHLVSADDYVAFRGAIQTMLTAAMESIRKTRKADFDIARVVAAAARRFQERPYTFAELRHALASDFPDVDERMMGYAARTSIPLVMVPDASDFAFAGATFVDAEQWLGRPVPSADRLPDLLLRYLAAFGPASVRDAQEWSGIGKLGPVFESLRPRLSAFRDEGGRELFDLPSAPRPAEDVEAPVRFIAAFDNLILAHADRSRIIAGEYRSLVTLKNLQVLPTFLVDGFVAGTWDVERSKKTARLRIQPFKALPRGSKLDLSAEGERLVRFLAHDAVDFDVEILAPSM
ncbi:MAG: winged helix DNA-binding domain-containing protein [Bryobacteraceae bacterium]